MRFVSPLLLIALANCTALSDLGDVSDQTTSDEPSAQSGPDAGSSSGGESDDPGPEPGVESLTLSLQTTPVGGEYEPANIVAVWIEDDAQNYVATLGRWSSVRTQHLVAWNTAAAGDVDVVSGATRPDHGETMQLVWEIPAAVEDGLYTLRVEIADGNSNTPDQNHQATIPFEKNGEARVEQPGGAGLAAISIDYSGR